MTWATAPDHHCLIFLQVCLSLTGIPPPPPRAAAPFQIAVSPYFFASFLHLIWRVHRALQGSSMQAVIHKWSGLGSAHRASNVTLSQQERIVKRSTRQQLRGQCSLFSLAIDLTRSLFAIVVLTKPAGLTYLLWVRWCPPPSSLPQQFMKTLQHTAFFGIHLTLTLLSSACGFWQAAQDQSRSRAFPYKSITSSCSCSLRATRKLPKVSLPTQVGEMPFFLV